MDYVELFYEILDETYFEDEIQFKCGRIVTSGFVLFQYFGKAYFYLVRRGFWF